MEEKRKKRRRWPLILAAAVILAGVFCLTFREPLRLIWYNNVDPLQPLPAGGEAWTGGRTLKGVAYAGESDSQYLNLYIPEAETPPPLLVIVHGGGFVLNDCESRQTRLFYSFFRERGFACATVNYRLAQEAVFPAAVEDVKCAVRFLRANAEQYGYNADRIAIWGESAGGYLAVMAGVTGEDFSSVRFLGEEELAEPVSGRIDFVLDYYGAVELESKEERSAAFAALGVPGWMVSIANTWLQDAIRDYPWAESCEDVFLGRPLKELSEEERLRASPLHHAEMNLTSGESPDFLILHGDADITVPRTQSQHLSEIIRERAGENRVTFEIIPNAKHADEDMYSAETLEKVLSWLEERRGRE